MNNCEYELFLDKKKISLDLIEEDKVIIVSVGTSGLDLREFVLKSDKDVDDFSNCLKEAIK